MHAVHNAIRFRTQIRGSLKNAGENKEYFFHPLRHGKHSVRRIAMEKKRLSKKRQIPMRYKEDEYNKHEQIVSD